MQISKLNQIIARFRQNEGTDIYGLGNCSEFAVALKKFLGAGTISKEGLWHSSLYYKNHYCDIYGCKKTSYGIYNRPGTKSENKHIKHYLEDGRHGKLNIMSKILTGLKKAKKQVK